VGAGQNWGNRAYFPRADRSLPVEEVLESFIAQFYDDKPVPRAIYLSHALPMQALLEEALSTKAERRVEIRVPQRGTKTTIVEHATQNAREALGRRLAETSSQRILLESLKERFGLANAPRRIEVFDNSHIQGASAVGAMIVAGAEGFVKNQYRKFNIKSETLTPGDDCSAANSNRVAPSVTRSLRNGSIEYTREVERKSTPAQRRRATPRHPHAIRPAPPTTRRMGSRRCRATTATTASTNTCRCWSSTGPAAFRWPAGCGPAPPT
jgi:hypothetical protein